MKEHFIRNSQFRIGMPIIVVEARMMNRFFEEINAKKEANRKITHRDYSFATFLFESHAIPRDASDETDDDKKTKTDECCC